MSNIIENCHQDQFANVQISRDLRVNSRATEPETPLEKRQAVRTLAHRTGDRSEELQKLGAEVVFGDFHDFDAVRAALSGVQRAYRAATGQCCSTYELRRNSKKLSAIGESIH